MKPHHSISTLKQSFKILMVSLLSLSCSLQVPRSSIAALDPGESKPRPWPIIRDETDDYELLLEPLDNVENSLAFAVTVYNKRMEDLYVDPNDWKMFTQSVDANRMITKDTLQLLTADKIASIYTSQAERISTRERRKKTALIIGSAVLIIGTLAVLANSDAADIDPDTEEVVIIEDPGGFSFGFYSGFNLGNAQSRQMSPKERIQFARDMSDRYANAEIVPTYIPPGEEISFDIYFPRHTDLKAFQLRWQLADKKLQWDFIHEVR